MLLCVSLTNVYYIMLAYSGTSNDAKIRSYKNGMTKELFKWPKKNLFKSKRYKNYRDIIFIKYFYFSNRISTSIMRK